MKRAMLALMMLGQVTSLLGQRTYDCGGYNQRACKVTDWEYYNMRWDFHKCEPDLQERDGVCVNRNRFTVPREMGWLGWAQTEQLYGVSGKQVVNRIPWLGAHNAFSSRRQGFNNDLYANQVYSVSDLLNMGVRHLELDPHYYTTKDPDLEVRLCHSGQAAICLSPGYGTRLFGYMLRELKQWLDANPEEVVILKLNEKNIDGLVPMVGFEEMYSLLERYLGSKAYRPPALFQRWPTLREIRAAGRQVLLMQHDQDVQARGLNLVWGARRLIQSNNWPKNQNFEDCISNDGVQHSVRGANEWWDVAEGRSLSNTAPIDDETGFLTETKVRQAVRCGVAIVGLDYIRALNSAPLGNRPNNFDQRIESMIWSFAENDFGGAGPMAMTPDTGDRWHSMAAGQIKAYACAAVRPEGDARDVRDWKITAAVGPWNQSMGMAMCVAEFGAGYEFTHPRNGYQNQDLGNLARQRGVQQLWIAYSTEPRGVVAVSRPEVTFTMNPGGPAPAAENVTFYGPAGTTATAEVGVNWLVPMGLTRPVVIGSSYTVPVAMTLNNAVVNTMPPGVYETNVRMVSTLNLGGIQMTFPVLTKVTLIIKRPVSLTLNAEAGQVEFGGRIRLLGTLPVMNPKVSGNVTYVRTNVADISSTAQTAPVVGNVATVDFDRLPAGLHTFVASYGGDGYYMAADSNEVTVRVMPRLAVTPESLNFAMDFGGAVPSGTTLVLGRAPSGTLQATKPCGWLTATVVGNTQVAVGFVSSQVSVLAPGSYGCDITLSDGLSATQGSTVVPVVLTVRTTLSAAPGSLTFLASTSGASREVFVTTPQNKTVTLTGTSNQPWLGVTVPNGQTPTNAVVSVNPNGLAPGTYTGTVTFQSPQAVNVASTTVTLKVVAETVVDSVPQGLRVVVDGAPLVTPAAVTWDPGTAHVISTDTIQQLNGASGIRYKFASWSNGGTQTQTVTAAFSGGRYVANFGTEYRLSTDVVPTAGGNVTRNPMGDGSGFYAAGTLVQLNAAPNSGYFFAGYSGEVSGNQAQVTVTMDRPRGTVARFEQRAAVEFTVDSNVAAMITVNGGAVAVPGKVLLVPGVTYTLGAPAVVAGAGAGQQWVQPSWVGLSGTGTVSYVAPATGTTLVLRYQQQYLVTATVSPANAGTVSGAGWVNAGGNVTLQATANSGFSFSGYSGSGIAASAANPLGLVVNGPLSVVANFTTVGTPNLFAASSGARTDGPGAGQRQVPIVLRNVGSGAAADVAITGVVNVAVMSGTGAVQVVTPAPVAVGTIAAGGQAGTTLVFDWPATATRVQFTVKFAANNGGYQGSTTLTLIR